MTIDKSQLEQLQHDLLPALATILEGHAPVLDKAGHAVLKPDGTPYMRLVPASHLKVVLEFLKLHGIGAVAKDGSDPMNMLAGPAARGGFQLVGTNMPPIDMELDDDAAN